MPVPVCVGVLGWWSVFVYARMCQTTGPGTACSHLYRRFRASESVGRVGVLWVLWLVNDRPALQKPGAVPALRAGTHRNPTGGLFSGHAHAQEPAVETAWHV